MAPRLTVPVAAALCADVLDAMELADRAEVLQVLAVRYFGAQPAPVPAPVPLDGCGCLYQGATRVVRCPEHIRQETEAAEAAAAADPDAVHCTQPVKHGFTGHDVACLGNGAFGPPVSTRSTRVWQRCPRCNTDVASDDLDHDPCDEP